MALTLLDIAKINNAGIAGLIDEATKATPEVRIGDARTISGINYKTLIRTGLPTAQFRNANEGVAASESTYENRLIECFLLDLQWQADKAVADSAEDGAEAVIAAEAAAVLESGMQHLGSQFYYGTDSDSKGFPGLKAQVDSSMVVDAGGSGSSCTSAWLVRFGPNYVRWVAGNNGDFAVSDVSVIQASDASGNVYAAYWQYLLARIGLQVGHSKAVAAIKNIDSSHTLTDDLLSDAIAKFPAGIVPDVIFMTRAAQKQLQQSRTATNPTGAPAPFPESAFGIPIQVTESLTDSETAW